MKNFRSGFTLVELLVVTALASLSAGVMLPVLQETREDARRLQCAKQISELAAGSALYESAFGRMPPLQTNTGSGPSTNISQHQHTGAVAYILPFIGQQKLFDLMPVVATQAGTVLSEMTAPISSFEELLKDEGMNDALNEKPAFLICPSNTEYSDAEVENLIFSFLQIGNSHSVITKTINSTAYGRTSYLPSLGGFAFDRTDAARGIDISREDAAGAMRNRDTSIPVSELGDGASNTICWSESLGRIAPAGELGNDTDQPLLQGVNSSLLHTAIITGDRWLVGMPGGTLFGSAEASLGWLIGSNHQDGNNIAMCDGSVRFLSSNTSRGVVAALGCGNDGWIVPQR